MNGLVKKVFQPTKTKLFWLYFVLGALLIVAGVALMPVWPSSWDWCFWKDWGKQIINILIAVVIVLYLVFFLIKKLRKRQKGVILVLTIVEFVLLALVALGCVLQQFKIINVGGACAIFGLALWCRGSVELFRAYYHQRGDNDRFPIWWLVISIAFVSFGAYLFAKPLFQDIVILWIFVVIVLLVGLILLIDGFLAKPASKKSK